MLKGNIDIFQITGKQFKPKGIEFTLHKPLRYSQSIENKIFLFDVYLIEKTKQNFVQQIVYQNVL